MCVTDTFVPSSVLKGDDTHCRKAEGLLGPGTTSFNKMHRWVVSFYACVMTLFSLGYVILLWWTWLWEMRLGLKTLHGSYVKYVWWSYKWDISGWDEFDIGVPMWILTKLKWPICFLYWQAICLEQDSFLLVKNYEAIFLKYCRASTSKFFLVDDDYHTEHKKFPLESFTLQMW